MSDRLAEIEATRKKILSEYEFSRADDDMLMLLTSGIPWLLARAHELDTQAELMVDVYKGADLPELVARVNAAEARLRELEAQAEKDAGVREAVYKLGEAEAHLNDGHYSLSRATEAVDLAAKTVSDIAEQMYYAALAAREAGE